MKSWYSTNHVCCVMHGVHGGGCGRRVVTGLPGQAYFRQLLQERSDEYQLRHPIHIPAPLWRVHRNLITTTLDALQVR